MRTWVAFLGFLFRLLISEAAVLAVGQEGVAPASQWDYPKDHLIKGNFTTYSGEPCIYHVPGGAFYGTSGATPPKPKPRRTGAGPPSVDVRIDCENPRRESDKCQTGRGSLVSALSRRSSGSTSQASISPGGGRSSLFSTTPPSRRLRPCLPPQPRWSCRYAAEPGASRTTG